MHSCVWPVLVLVVAVALRTDARLHHQVHQVHQSHQARNEHDFEFDDEREQSGAERAAAPHRYLYAPHDALCRALVCKKREVCVLRDALTALCAARRDVLRQGDMIVSGASAEWERGSEEDDVFYEAGGEGGEAGEGGGEAARCVGCPAHGAAARAQFLCGSDNRTYSSLCRLDLHNCVRRAEPPVRLACRGFCPCARSPAARRRADAARRRVAAPGCALDNMANRLLDWFSVLMDDAGAQPPPPDGFPGECKPEVRWMFAHLDTERDGVLSARELYALRHDERERCLRPFLASCGRLTRAAWCACMRRAARPCRALARANPARRGAYVPACDARGYYRPRQCHRALGVCWCVDPHGVELPGSRTKGAPACPGDKSDAQEVEGAPDDDEDGAGTGSGDGDLHY